MAPALDPERAPGGGGGDPTRSASGVATAAASPAPAPGSTPVPGPHDALDPRDAPDPRDPPEPPDPRDERPGRARSPWVPRAIAVASWVLLAVLALAYPDKLREPDPYAYRAAIEAIEQGDLTPLQVRALAKVVREEFK